MSELLVYEIVLYTSCAWGATTLTTQIEHKENIEFLCQVCWFTDSPMEVSVAPILGYPPKRTCY